MWSLPSRPLAAVALIGALVTCAVSSLSGSTGATGLANPIQCQVQAPGSPAVPGINLIRNCDFSNGMDFWIPFATPDLDHIGLQVTDDRLQFYKVPVPSTQWHNQAVVFQFTWTQLEPGSPLVSKFDLGNSSDVRKRISVLIQEGDFSDLHVCTFWLAPHSPMRTYEMKTHTSRVWYNTTIAFYAASGGSFGGFYEVDDVSLTYEPSADLQGKTICSDPTAPAPTPSPDGPNLLQNGDFSNGLAPWAVLFNLTHQLANGVFEFVWSVDATPTYVPPFPSFEPAPVLIQRTGVPMAAGEILTAQMDLGNSSSVRKRVSILVHQWDFADLAACTFWLEPHTPLQTYTMRIFTTEAWTDAAFSVYAATRGSEEWIQLDNASLKRTPGAQTSGKECYEPGALQPQPVVAPNLKAGAAKAPAVGMTGAPAQMGTGLLGRMAAERLAALNGSVRAGSSLRYRLPPSPDERAIQVSTDNETWTTLLVVPPSEEWQIFSLDLTSLALPFAFIRVQ
jgi:hypothetical protein